MARCTASAAGGTSQRLQPGGATMAARLRKPALVGLVTVDALSTICRPAAEHYDPRRVVGHTSASQGGRMGRVTVRRPVLHIADGTSRRRPDALAAEEPLELRVDGASLAVTMRTPGHDVELAHGFLLTEGVIGAREDVATARYCDSVDDSGRNTYNVLDVALAPGVPPPDVGVERNFYTTSSCGVCGKAALDAVRTRTRFAPG